MSTEDYIEAYYVDPKNGDDSNSGTEASPFKTIQHGIDIAGANNNDGNRVLLQGGTYNLTQPLEINRHSGTKDAFLTIEPVSGERVILDGGKIARQSSLIEIRNVRRVNIVGLEIRNAPSHGIEVVNGKYINLANNLIHHTQGMGIRVRGYTGENLEYEADTTVQSSDIVIDGNEVYQTNLSNSGINKGVNNWGGGIQAWNVDDIIIVNNTVGENYGEGIGLTLADDSVVANNTLYDNFSAQVYLDNVTDSLVETNFIHNTGNSDFYRDDLPANGISLANEIHNVFEPESFYLDDNLIRRNIIVGADSGIIYGTWAGLHQDIASNNFQGLKDTTITHNTIYDSVSSSLRFYADPNNTDVNVSHNIFYQETGEVQAAIDSLTGVNFNRNLWFGAEAGDGYRSTDIFTDPLFINPGGNSIADYQLQADSLGINAIAGDNGYWITDNRGDFGALEFGEAVFETGHIVE